MISCTPQAAETWLRIGETSKSIFKKLHTEILEARKDILEFSQYEEERLVILKGTGILNWPGEITLKTWTKPDHSKETQWVYFPVLGSLTTRAANAVALEAARISIIENMIHNYGKSGMSLKVFLTTLALWEARS